MVQNGSRKDAKKTPKLFKNIKNYNKKRFFVKNEQKWKRKLIEIKQKWTDLKFFIDIGW